MDENDLFIINLKTFLSEVRSAVMGISPISGVRYDIQYHGWYERYFGAGLNKTNDSFAMSHIIWVILTDDSRGWVINSCVYPDEERKRWRLKTQKNHMCPLGKFKLNVCSMLPPLLSKMARLFQPYESFIIQSNSQIEKPKRPTVILPLKGQG